ncbi:MAG: SPOR domain-containing protein [Novosphingobium sp.]|nr:SPOR domain-containing protein [Novosphingobium sp.]
MRSLRSAALAALGLLALATAAPAKDRPTALPVADPSAVLGEPYVAAGVTYVPVDAPFDDVGHAGLDENAGPGISVSHRTLPLPSYVEVTALDSGRTILARVERRGPASGKQLIGLSAGGFAQLAADSAVPLAVRVRRVNPQEYERALLRTDQRAPERLVTPGPLVEVLRNLLARKGDAVPTAEAAEPSVEPTPVALALSVKPEPAKAAPPRPAPVKSTAPPAGGAFAVQVAAFANRANADATGRKLGGRVIGSARLWRVQLGPFADRAAAQAGIARAKKAGFGDARIVSAGK